MNKTSIYLSDEEKQRLAQLARIEGTSQTEILRAALRAYHPPSRLERSALNGCANRPDVSIAVVSSGDLLVGFGEN